jgi:riboflavin biosynthesis pyrimidine reductase
MAPVRRLLPGPVLDPLDDEALAAAYAVPEGARSHVRVNFVTSADGGVTVEGRSGGLSSAADKRTFALLRDLADVVVAGAGTVRVEGYGPQRYGPERRERRRALGRAEQPTIAVVSASLDLDPASPLFADADPAARTMVITHRAAPADRLAALADVAHVLLAGDDRVDLAAAVGAGPRCSARCRPKAWSTSCA